MIQPIVGHGNLTRQEAHDYVLDLLRARADAHPAYRAAVNAWQAQPHDNTVTAGPFTWTIYSYSGGDPDLQARRLLHGYICSLRRAGLTIVQTSKSLTANPARNHAYE